MSEENEGETFFVFRLLAVAHPRLSESLEQTKVEHDAPGVIGLIVRVSLAVVLYHLNELRFWHISGKIPTVLSPATERSLPLPTKRLHPGGDNGSIAPYSGVRRVHKMD